MLAQKYYHYKRHFDQDGVIFSFSGFISEEILFALGEALKKKLILDAEDPNKIKHVFSVFIELVQNVIHHSAECTNGGGDIPDMLSSGMINVGSQGGRFYVGCGNITTIQNATGLQERLKTIQGLDKEELRFCYRKKLKEKMNMDTSKGANLGLIEIARRSSAPIEFDFLKVDANKTFYYIKSYI